MWRVSPDIINEAAEELRTPMLDLLQQLARMESPSHDAAAQLPVMERLSDELNALEFATWMRPGRSSGGFLYARPAERKRDRPLQLLLGHCDTVWPKGTLKRMPVSVRNGQVAGPGVYDMKGGLTQIIFALRLLREVGVELRVTPVVLINSDEEIGSHESQVMIRRLARIVDRTYVLEPSLGPDGKLKTARKGGGRFTVVVRGKAAHAGLDPEKGASAIVELAHVIQQLHALNDYERGISVNVGQIDGGIRPNVVAPESTAIVDVRVPTHADAARIEAHIKALKPQTPGVALEIKGGIGRPPMEPTPRNRRLWRAARDAGSQLGLRLKEGTAGGGSDGNTTSLFTATLDGLGAVGDGAHATHEHLLAHGLVERTALLAMLLLFDPFED